MPYLFSSPGRAAVIASEAALPALISVVGGWGGFTKFRCILTGAGLAGTSAAQFAHTMRDRVYTYVFGERIGELTLNGIAFAGSCIPNERSTGLDWLVWYYNSFRVSTTGRPVSIVLGATTALDGFLIAFNVQATDTETGTAQFTLTFRYPPPLPTEIRDSRTGKITYFFTPPADDPADGGVLFT